VWGWLAVERQLQSPSPHLNCGEKCGIYGVKDPSLQRLSLRCELTTKLLEASQPCATDKQINGKTEFVSIMIGSLDPTISVPNSGTRPMRDFTPTHGKILPNDLLPTEVLSEFTSDAELLYVLPRTLLEAINKGLPKALSQADFDRELRLADCGERFDAIAFRHRSPVTYIRLADRLPPVDKDFLSSAADPQAAARAANEVFAASHECSQAYLGWLLQCQEFQNDVSEIREIRCESCLPLGPPPPYPADSRGVFDQLFTPDQQTQVRKLCKRWRLDGFTTLDLPNPLEPHFATSSPYNENARTGGAAPFIPDIYPVKGRGEAVDRIRASFASNNTAHLSGWLEIISPSCKRSPQLSTLARQFRFQHYWRVVQSRYVSEVAKKTGKLRDAFAIFLGTHPETLRKEGRKIDLCLEVPLSTWV
jgi:hypothetical protein